MEFTTFDIRIKRNGKLKEREERGERREK